MDFSKNAIRRHANEYAAKLRSEGRLIKGAYYDDSDDELIPSFCLVGAISDSVRLLEGQERKDWEAAGNYDDMTKLSNVSGFNKNSLDAIDVIFEHRPKLEDKDFLNCVALLRNTEWSMRTLYISMIRSVYKSMYIEAGLERKKGMARPDVTWENWPELRGELRRNLPKGFMFEYDFYMVDLLIENLNNASEFKKYLGLYLKGEYDTIAHTIQKLKSHTKWDAKAGSIICT